MRLKQDTNTTGSLGNEFVAMVGKHGQTSTLDRVDHGLGQAFLGVQKVSLDSLNVHQQVLCDVGGELKGKG